MTQNIVTVLRDMLHRKRVDRAQKRLEHAVRAKARASADAQFNREMANFYTERVLQIDPHTAWWDFADAKQKQFDYQQEVILHDEAAKAAGRIVEQRAAKFRKLTETVVVPREEADTLRPTGNTEDTNAALQTTCGKPPRVGEHLRRKRPTWTPAPTS